MSLLKRGRVLFIVVVTLCLVTSVGCGGRVGPDTVAVVGAVTLNGTPVEAASVTFFPTIGSDDGRLASQAATDRDGKFLLRTHIGGGSFKPGIVPGQYVISVVKLDTAAAKTMVAPPKNLLPARYADPKTSQLTADVKPGVPYDAKLSLKAD